MNLNFDMFFFCWALKEVYCNTRLLPINMKKKQQSDFTLRCSKQCQCQCCKNPLIFLIEAVTISWVNASAVLTCRARDELLGNYTSLTLKHGLCSACACVVDRCCYFAASPTWRFTSDAPPRAPCTERAHPAARPPVSSSSKSVFQREKSKFPPLVDLVSP